MWARASTNESAHGTIRLAVVSTTAITPTTPTVPTTPTQPTTTTVSVSNYAGIATDAKNETSQITLAITDTKNVRTGVLNILDTNHAAPLAFSISSSLTFSFSFSETNEVDTVTGKISADGKTITGGWTSFHADGGTGSGTFTATRT